MTTTPTPTARETRQFLDALAKKRSDYPSMAADAAGAAVVRDDPALFVAAHAYQQELTKARRVEVAKGHHLAPSPDLAVAIAKSAVDEGGDVGEALAQYPGAYEQYIEEMRSRSRSTPRAAMR